MIPAVNALQPGSAQRQQIRAQAASNSPRSKLASATLAATIKPAIAKVKQRWMKDKTGMLQHRIEIAAFDCWWKYPHEGIGPQHYKQ